MKENRVCFSNSNNLFKTMNIFEELQTNEKGLTFLKQKKD
jgi:hypothetical protein